MLSQQAAAGFRSSDGPLRPPEAPAAIAAPRAPAALLRCWAAKAWSERAGGAASGRRHLRFPRRRSSDAHAGGTPRHQAWLLPWATPRQLGPRQSAERFVLIVDGSELGQRAARPVRLLHRAVLRLESAGTPAASETARCTRLSTPAPADSISQSSARASDSGSVGEFGSWRPAPSISLCVRSCPSKWFRGAAVHGCKQQRSTIHAAQTSRDHCSTQCNRSKRQRSWQFSEPSAQGHIRGKDRLASTTDAGSIGIQI